MTAAAVLSTISLAALAGAAAAPARAAMPSHPPVQSIGLTRTCASLAAAPRVYSSGTTTVDRVDAQGGHLYWACRAGRGSATLLSLAGGRPAYRMRIGRFAAAGPYLAALTTLRGRHTIELTDVAGGAMATADARAQVGDILVSSVRPAGRARWPSTGAVVWTQRGGGRPPTVESLVSREFARRAEAGTGTLATGPIAPGSLHLRGLRASFVQHGRRHSVRLP